MNMNEELLCNLRLQLTHSIKTLPASATTTTTSFSSKVTTTSFAATSL